MQLPGVKLKGTEDYMEPFVLTRLLCIEKKKKGSATKEKKKKRGSYNGADPTLNCRLSFIEEFSGCEGQRKKRDTRGKGN